MEGYVYIVGSTTFGWYKIGKTKNPEVRVSQLGILLPFKLEVIGIWKAANHHAMEKALHEMYKKNKINGEWFEFTKKELYAASASIPSETKIYSIADNNGSFEKFSNIDEDTRNNRKIIGPRLQKLRGDFTPDERELRKVISMEHQSLRKRLKSVTGYSNNIVGLQIACNNPHTEKKVKLNIFTSIIEC